LESELAGSGIRGSLEDAQDGSRGMSFDTKCWWRADAATVARSLGLARVTVRKYVDQAAPGGNPRRASASAVWDAVADRVQTLLAESVRWTGGKQRLTATRLHELLLAEG